MVLSLNREADLIPGYSCIDRIGAGGYGEVWSVEAPGGIPKAIKLVYGYIDEDRAARELKALNRIKEVRHPFLLALDRIEVVDNRLLIVTELAEKSLLDRFNECRQEGATGIPRDELLHYVRESADALDFMFDRYRLQHLDIKPENLLLLGSHVKVADFGLVKDQVDQTHSEVAGLTPIYAAPELFDGSASRQCDQYSLAIVYLQMLTGHLPFPGRTALQLAAQHAKARPRLNWLSETDQEVVAKALSKQCTDRYPSCTAFANALANPATMVPAAAPSHVLPPTADSAPSSSSAPETSPTGSPSDVDAQSAAIATEAISAELVATPSVNPTRRTLHISTDVERLDRVTDVELASGWRPTMFIGVGGTGARIVHAVRARVAGRAELLETDAVQFISLDTDREDVQALSSAEAGGGGPRTALRLPLRRPQEYRSGSKQLLAWMSRRWLYNIPPSLQTRGLRPLGRLAWVDHQEKFGELLRKRLERLASADAIEELEELTGQPCRNTVPRIFVVASTAGGTGGGMILDVIETLKALLVELQISGEGLTCLLTHSTNRRPADCDLALANTYGTLAELHHLAVEQSQASSGGNHSSSDFSNLTPANTYFLHLGDHLNGEEYAARVERAAQYLFLDLATEVGGLFDHCRALGKQEVADQDLLFLRSFQTADISVIASDLVTRSTTWLMCRIVDAWCEQIAPSASGGQATREAAGATDAASSADGEANVPPPLFAAALQQAGERAFAHLARSRFARELIQRLEREWSLNPNTDSRASQGRLRSLSKMANEAARQFHSLIDHLESSDETLGDTERPAWATDPLAGSVMRRLTGLSPQISDELLAECHEQLLAKREGSAGDVSNITMIDFLTTVLESRVEEVVQQVAAERAASPGHTVLHGPVDPSAALATLEPPFEGCGYATRDFFIVPENAGELVKTEGECGDSCTISTAGELESPVAVREVERLSLIQLARMLTRDRPDVVDAAGRLHTRKDVAWAPLPHVE